MGESNFILVPFRYLWAMKDKSDNYRLKKKRKCWQKWWKLGVNSVKEKKVGGKTLVFLQNSRSLQQLSSTTWSGLLLGSMYTAPIDDVNTTLRTLASAAAIITFFVPFTAGSTISSFKNQQIQSSLCLVTKTIPEYHWLVQRDHFQLCWWEWLSLLTPTTNAPNIKFLIFFFLFSSGKTEIRTHWIIGDRRSSVENSMAPIDGLFQTLIIHKISFA